jgi:hypothetical protein
MANYLAIAAVAKTVLKLMENHCPRDEFATEPQFVLYSGHDFQTPTVTEGFSLLVWRVAINTTLRNQPPRRTSDGRRRRPALPLDLGLMLTPWAADAEGQLRLMGWALRFIEDHSMVPAALLNQALSRREVQAFGADEAIELVHDTPSLPDYLGLWDKFRNRWQTSITCTVRMVNIESEISITEGPPVQVRDIDYGQPAEPAVGGA